VPTVPPTPCEGATVLNNTFLYQLLFLLHITAVVVGFGSSFVYPVLATRSRKLPAKEAYAVNHTAFSISRYMTSYPIYAAGAFGLALILASGAPDVIFKQRWVSIAFFLFILGVLAEAFLLYPNAKAMDALLCKIAEAPDGQAKPKELTQLDECRSRAGMYGGILHLFFLLLMIDMIWKPGSGF
jgi:hypothetical protein